MISPQNRYLLFLSLISVAVLFLDQISKALVLANLEPHVPVRLIDDFLRLTLAYNEGGAFSTRLGPSLFYAIASLIVVSVVMVFLYRQAGRNRLVDFALALVIGGALGNLIDRAHFGSVVDWIDVEFFDFNLAAGKILFIDHGGYQLTRWPVFNVADAAVTVGIILVIFSLLFQRQRGHDVDPECDS